MSSHRQLINTIYDSYSLLAPGPVNLHPEVQKILAEPMIHHRTPAFDKIFSQVKMKLKDIFETTNDVFILSSTGSGGMEALITNTMAPGDKVLALVSGKFGERWAEMAEVYGANVIRYNIPWGESAHLDAVEDYFKSHHDIKFLLCQACETSTAVLHPIAELGELAKKYNSLFLVDGITAVGAMKLPMDSLSIDGLVAGSQKAFMLPTGLSFVSFSERAWLKINKNPQPRYYFDIRKEKKANDKGETFFSSSVPLIKALDWVLNEIEQTTFDQHVKIIQSRAQATQNFFQAMCLKLYSKSPSPTLTAIEMPLDIDSQKVRTQLEVDYQITVMGGQDQLKGKILRIGHMGYILPIEMKKLFMATVEIIFNESKQKFDFESTLKIADCHANTILNP